MQKSPEYADTVGIQEEGTRPDASHTKALF